MTYYVATTGSDQNSGLSRTRPWLTIQKAANTMQHGDTTIVLAGTYDERVSVSRSGAAGKPITFEADSGASVVTRGFQITGSHIQVVGFEITNHNTTDPSFYGVYVVGSNNLISQNYIHDLCADGIKLSGNGERNSASTSHNSLVDNRLVHCEMAGIHVEGQDNLVQGNDISATAQYPANCPRRNGADADGMRFFGSGQIMRGNYIHDIRWGTPENPDPHDDCFQTWGPASNITIERNLCVWPATSESTINQVSMIESRDGLSTNITYRNNIFVDMRQGINVHGANAIKFFNNTFDHILQEAVILRKAPNSQIVNNIFYDVGNGSDSYVCTDDASQSGLLITTNDQYMPSGLPGTYCSNASHLTLDPLFADPTRLDFHLRPNSPMINAGATLPSVTNDYYGKTRPHGNRYDIGAIESSPN